MYDASGEALPVLSKGDHSTSTAQSCMMNQEKNHCYHLLSLKSLLKSGFPKCRLPLVDSKESFAVKTRMFGYHAQCTEWSVYDKMTIVVLCVKCGEKKSENRAEYT